MNLTGNFGSGAGLRKSLAAAVALSVSALLSGCYTVQAVKDFDRTGGASLPWWCKAANPADKLSTREACTAFSLQMDVAVDRASAYPTLGDALAAGAIAPDAYPDGVGHAVLYPGASLTQFDPARPNVLLYTGTELDSRLAGVAWRFFGPEPVGFDGDRDVWTFDNGSSHWWLNAWVVRGYQNHPNVFAASHPCLADGVTLLSTTDACFIAAHTEPFEVVVTNDDGYGAEGIGALVDGLVALPNVNVHVVAPLANQSGSGDDLTETPYNTFVDEGATYTTGGVTAYPATAVSSTDTLDLNPQSKRKGSGSPADSVVWALEQMQLSPELVLSGINAGQNLTRPIVNVSGTVGAARTARRMGIPAIATSQGHNAGFDFPAGVAGTLAVLEEWRLGIRQPGIEEVPNINTPTCTAGSVRGILDVAISPSYGNGAQDCLSTETVIATDLEAFFNGFIGVSDVTTEAIP